MQETCFEKLIATRHSCRRFLPDRVPDDLIDRLFAAAQRTPSWCNTQPWQVHLLEGEALAEFVTGLGEHLLAHQAVADLGLPEYDGVHAVRRRESSHALYAALGIDREDRQARQRQALENFSLFGAPHSAIVTTDRRLGAYGAVDCGAYVHAVLLSAHALGLGAIAQGAIALYSDFVRQWLELPADRLVVCAVSFGHVDQGHSVNGFRTTRAPLAEVVRRVGVRDLSDVPLREITHE